MNEIEIFSGEFNTKLSLEYADSGIFAGFPSPAQDYIDLFLKKDRYVRIIDIDKYVDNRNDWD